MGTVLVIDDDPIITTLVSHALTSSGHRVISTVDSSEALELAHGQGAEVAVIDLVMPGIDGLELVQKLRQDPELCDMAVLILSAKNTTDDRILGLRVGADDYLGKPFDLDELVLRVERLMERVSRTRSVPQKGPQPKVATGFGRYEIRELLGRGAMGKVFKAWDPILKRWIALKTLKLDEEHFLSASFDPIAALIQEASLAAQINHSNVVTVYDAATTDNGSFIAMEYVDGPGLDSVIHQRGRLSQGHAVTIAIAVASALEAAHDRGLIHRDVKLANILLSNEGGIKLSDFGLAGVVATMARQTGHAFGTPGYIAPEALRGRVVDARSDLFALGVVLYACLTGQTPFMGTTIPKIVRATLNTRPVAPHRLLPDIDEEVSELTMRLLTIEPNDRYQSARALIRALRGLASEPWSASLFEGVTREQVTTSDTSMKIPVASA